MTRYNSCFWAVAAIVSAAIAAIFLVLFIFNLLPVASTAIWITAAISALILLVLLIKAPNPTAAWPFAVAAPAEGSAAAPARYGCGCRCHCACPVYNSCCFRWVGALAGALAAAGFGAAFLAAAGVAVVAEVFFFLAIAAFVFEAILLVAHAACKCRQAR